MDVDVKPEDGGPTRTFFIGCAEMIPRDVNSSPHGKVFVQRTFPSSVLPGRIGTTGTVAGLSIVFDEGNDAGSGYTVLDDIAVEVDGVVHRRTSARDNGNK